MEGIHKKHKFDKTTGVEAMVLTEGDLDEIGDIVRTTIKEIWGHIKDEYQSVLSKVQVGLIKL